MWPFSRKGSSGFSSYSTAEEVADGLDGSGLTAIITGATSGLGAETARVLAMRGVHVIITGRNMEAGRAFKEAIEKEVPGAKLDVKELDLSSMESVRRFASGFLSQGLPLNLLINNAGILGPPFTLSKDNIELQFATNHIGHFLLTSLLLDTMKKTAKESGIEGRIINLSSEAHWLTYREGIRFDKINDPSGYTGFKGYCQSKLANILHANELAKRLKEEEVNITVNSVHPGAILTNITRYLSHSWFSGFMKLCGKVINLFLKNVQQGAATTCYVALHPQVEGVTGEYFADCNISKRSSQAKDAEMAKKLWDFSMDLINQSM